MNKKTRAYFCRCGNSINYTTFLRGGTCKSCSNKTRADKTVYLCLICSKIISRKLAIHGTGRCRSCVHKGNHAGYKDGRSLKNYFCKYCGKQIAWQTVLYHSGRCKSCSQKRELNHNWNNGSSFEPYPLGWTKTFTEQIRYRDGYKCQLCGCSEVENGRKLCVHHKDYIKKNINPENLIALCHSCHSKTNTNRKYWLNYFKVNKKLQES